MTVELDVPAAMKDRKRKRRPGEVPYPLDYDRELTCFDAWDYGFMFKLSGRLCLHDPQTPPKICLDLGCGGGTWCIEAAKVWTESTFIGMDMKDLQPSPAVLENTLYAHIAPRLKWVHGNILDRLPFASNHFDFVRIANIGMGVPEDEWQDVLEEVNRVLKPGGVFELIEEDLIFPAEDLLEQSEPLRPPLAVPYRSPPKGSSDRLTIHASVSSPLLSPGGTTHSATPPSPSPSYLGLPDENQTPRPPTNPQDHTKLKRAWDAMLNSRFLPPRPLSVLPLYLGTNFVDVRTIPIVQVPLPPNSSHETSRRRYLSSGGASTSAKSIQKTICDLDVGAHVGAMSYRHVVRKWAPLSLARSVRVVCGCKEAIWAQFANLYGGGGLGGKCTMSKKDRGDCRTEFEMLFANWLSDMQDRIGSRAMLVAQSGWFEPEVGDGPEWRIWRSSLPDSEGQIPIEEGIQICRSVRGFVGRKAVENSSVQS